MTCGPGAFRRAGGALATALLLLSGPALAATVTGTVFEDANGNGVHDRGEAGLPGIAVSNGRAIVRSDAQGAYAIDAGASDVVFAIKPPGRAFDKRDDGLPAFWRLAGEGGRFDIALSPPRMPKGPLGVLLFTDPQVASVEDVGHYAVDIVQPLLGTTAALGMTMGDVVADDLSLYPAINQATAALGVPWLHVAGNHDLDAAAAADAGSLATFHRTFGPDTVAWEEPQATFIGLDDVVATPGRRPAYVGGLRADQFAFLEAYLPTLPKDRLLVLGVHIPLFDTASPGAPPSFRPADRERLFALLEGFPNVLVLSGHTHTQRHVFHGRIHEYNLGAACGAFWSGVDDPAGVPDATMADGTPNGYARLEVRQGGEYALSWHNARDPGDTTIGLHAPRVLRRGAYPAWGVYANVYMGMDDTLVEYRIDDGAWKPMRKVMQPDPRLVAENVRDDAARQLRGYDRSPEAEPSAHLWRGALATDLAPGEHVVEVRYTDPWRGEQRATTGYRLADAAP
jgi:hypothetical protein